MLSKFSWSFHTLGMVARKWTPPRGCLEPQTNSREWRWRRTVLSNQWSITWRKIFVSGQKGLTQRRVLARSPTVRGGGDRVEMSLSLEGGGSSANVTQQKCKWAAPAPHLCFFWATKVKKRRDLKEEGPLLVLPLKPAPNPSGNVQDLLGGNLPVVNSLHSTDARLGQTVFPQRQSAPSWGLQLVQHVCVYNAPSWLHQH